MPEATVTTAIATALTIAPVIPVPADATVSPSITVMSTTASASVPKLRCSSPRTASPLHNALLYCPPMPEVMAVASITDALATAPVVPVSAVAPMNPSITVTVTVAPAHIPKLRTSPPSVAVHSRVNPGIFFRCLRSLPLEPPPTVLPSSSPRYPVPFRRPTPRSSRQCYRPPIAGVHGP
eukprot:CAMPEP_0181340024 /NCGR_PEP_ID=MMETSP1101-20121128/29606_1 /TAXON_ID=46948 /ORGANISM="Rhodomonas abbreviata, Strain Caron Lab Isolate" /LENGTH=179 /DNA_ID=CAMNT_0023451107 /DNA_START=46 /DNA_END=588 /DNA_ORIENTATION=-